MKTKFWQIIVILALLASVAVPGMLTRAALPSPMSWVKSGSNPVAPAGLCGAGITPTRPALLVDSDNYKMYFTTYVGADGAQIYLATSTDGGLSWSCANSGSPVLTLGATGTWDAIRVTTPTVLKDGGGMYHMWYTGRNAAGVYAIGYATSSDGVAWTKSGSNPVFTSGAAGAWDSAIVREPSVVLVSGVYHLWYSGTDNWPYFKIGHATSSDGISWSRDSANPVLTPTSGTWDSNEVYAPSVVLNGSVFEMFYSGNNAGRWLTGHASSSDGVVWTKDANAFLTPSTSGWDNQDSTDYVGAVLDAGTWKVFYSGASTDGYQIGLITLQDQAQLTFNRLSSVVGVGSTVDVYIDVNAVTDLFGYQFQVNYNPSLVSASAAFVDSFFDTSTNAWIPPTWNADCSSGSFCLFAVTKQNPGTDVNGSGPLARITFTGVAPGETALTFSNDILSDIDANAIPHTRMDGWLTVYGTATLSGVVSLQGRATPLDVGTVTLYEHSGYSSPTVVNFSATTGAWTATVPVGASGSYNIVASHGLYLSNRLDDIAVSVGGSYVQPATRLRGGDVNNNSVIEITDLTCIGGAFGGAPTSCGGTGSSDINLDGVVNILDLVLPGGNYGLTSPQAWDIP